MLLDALKNFSWYNEPADVRFIEAGMQVDVKTPTDFWQNGRHNVHKDDGHFFYTAREGDFTLTLKWFSEAPLAYAQCGIMARFNNLNWAKSGIMSPNLQDPQLGTIVTQRGNSDWASAPLSVPPAEVWYRLRRRGGDFIFSYSLDGQKFVQLRLFQLEDENSSLKVGAYACSPQLPGFRSILEQIEFSA